MYCSRTWYLVRDAFLVVEVVGIAIKDYEQTSTV